MKLCFRAFFAFFVHFRDIASNCGLGPRTLLEHVYVQLAKDLSEEGVLKRGEGAVGTGHVAHHKLSYLGNLVCWNNCAGRCLLFLECRCLLSSFCCIITGRRSSRLQIWSKNVVLPFEMSTSRGCCVGSVRIGRYSLFVASTTNPDSVTCPTMRSVSSVTVIRN